MPKRSTAAAEPAAPARQAAPKRAAPPRKTKKSDTTKLSPLDYMLQVLRDPDASPAERKWAAEKAAPFVHPRLQSVEHGGEVSLRHEDALEALK